MALPLLLILSLLAPAAANEDLAALLALKASLDPAGSVLGSWTDSGDPCSGEFEGVRCNGLGRVANISLQGKGLNGYISPAVGRLRSLSGLFLHYNRLSGVIPEEIGDLMELSDLYLNVNGFSGEVPAGIGSLSNLQVLQLGYNNLIGSIPSQIGSLKKLNVLALQSNHLTGAIPASLGDLPLLRRIDLSSNQLFGSIPSKLVLPPNLKSLDLRNNRLSGKVPNDLKKIGSGFHYRNNKDLCGVGFPSLETCKSEILEEIPQSATIKPNDYNSTSPPSSSPSSPIKIAIIAFGSAIIILILIGFVCYRRRKQKIGSSLEISEGKLSTDLAIDVVSKAPTIGFRHSWDSSESLKFNLEEIESATQHFSDSNLLGRSSFVSTYKGILRDGSLVAVKRISRNSCRAEEGEFFNGLKLLASLLHDNLVALRGFCCSTDRGECFLVYDFAANGNLSQYLETKDKLSFSRVLTWPERVGIVKGIARGLEYLHSAGERKPALIHQNLSTDKILLDDHCRPLIAGAGVQRLLANDAVFSGQKASAAMGYLAPEYAIAGRFSEKSDVYAFGVVVLQILTGKSKVNPLRPFADPGKIEDFVDQRLEMKYPKAEATKLVALVLACTSEVPSLRPTMAAVVQDLSKLTD